MPRSQRHRRGALRLDASGAQCYRNAIAMSEGVVQSPLPREKLRVHYFQRRKRPNSNFSLEFIFDDVRRRLSGEIEARTITAPWYSNGLVPRIGIAMHAAATQGAINHVTGDITFVAIALRKRNTVLTMLDCGSVLQSAGIKRMVLQKLWLELPVARSSVITTISEQSKSEIVKLTDCDPSKVVVVPVAISESFTFSPKPFNQTEPRILALGTAPNKNLGRLLAALEGLSCTLVVIGQLQREHLEAINAKGLKVENYCNLTAAEVVEQYRRCDLVAFASYYEGFGMPIIEGQAVGRPVLTGNVSAMPEVAGDAALLVDPFDVRSIRAGIKRIVEDGPLRETLVERGRDNVKRFDAERIARQYLQIYRRISAG